ncbi:hypothetical protein ACJX0J_023309, partial [Zea mays]
QPPRDVRSPRTVVVAAGTRVSGAEARTSLVLALASHALSASQRRFAELADEALDSCTFFAVPDLETVPLRILKRKVEYEIREVESYFVAETTMPERSGFDFSGSSQSFNVLASYLFGKNTASEQMEMTTPLNSQSMDMTPVITKKVHQLVQNFKSFSKYSIINLLKHLYGAQEIKRLILLFYPIPCELRLLAITGRPLAVSGAPSRKKGRYGLVPPRRSYELKGTKHTTFLLESRCFEFEAVRYDTCAMLVSISLVHYPVHTIYTTDSSLEYNKWSYN